MPDYIELYYVNKLTSHYFEVYRRFWGREWLPKEHGYSRTFTLASYSSMKSMQVHYFVRPSEHNHWDIYIYICVPKAKRLSAGRPAGLGHCFPLRGRL